ncbi:efflux RND transporter periplasmic adaptor subunit [bacterium]|nr:efflux RND transporter periplasmic adaptor subunit [bacterium]
MPQAAKDTSSLSAQQQRLIPVVILAVAALLWMASGVVRSDDTTSAEQPSDSPVFTVRAATIEANSVPIAVYVRGRTKANREVDVKAEISGSLVKAPAKRGSNVSKGDVLCQIAADDRHERLAQAQASLKSAQLEYDGALRLKRDGFQSKTDIANKFAQLQTAKASLKNAELNIERLSVRAPFDGTIDKRYAEAGDLLTAGQACAKIIELNPLLISGQLTEKDLHRVSNDQTAEVHIAKQMPATATVNSISKRADDVTRTFEVELLLENPGLRYRAGITTDIYIRTGETKAHRISPALLQLDDKGGLVVSTLNKQGDHFLVQRLPVTVVKDEPLGSWVVGLPEQVQLITAGQEYVAHGQIFILYTSDADDDRQWVDLGGRRIMKKKE